MAATDFTTLKVTKALRARISTSAAARSQTAQQFLEQILDERDRQNRLSTMADAMATADSQVLDEWRAETQMWESAQIDTDA